VRDTDPVEIPSAAGLLFLGLPHDPQLGTIASADPGLAAQLRQARRSFQDPIIAARARRLAARANVQIPTGLPDTEALIDALCVGLARHLIIAMFLPRAPLGQPVAVPAPKPGPTQTAAFAGMSPEQRIRLLLERTPKELGPDLARAFRSMVTTEALAGIAAAFAVLLAAQFVGVGEIADAALAWWAYWQAGFAGLAGLAKVLRAVVAAVRATNESDFDQAVKHFAEGLTVLGVALLTAVITRAARRRAGGSESAPAADDAPGATVRRDVGKQELNAPQPRTTYEVNGYVYKTDGQGRVSEVTGQLRQGPGVRNRIAQRLAGGDDRLPTDDGGHLIATRFDGSGEGINLVPQDSTLNRGDWKAMENGWARAVNDGKSVDVAIKPSYDGDSSRPDMFTVQYHIEGEDPVEETFDNDPGD
jgi:hypothetical protein